MGFFKFIRFVGEVVTFPVKVAVEVVNVPVKLIASPFTIDAVKNGMRRELQQLNKNNIKGVKRINDQKITEIINFLIVDLGGFEAVDGVLYGKRFRRDTLIGILLNYNRHGDSLQTSLRCLSSKKNVKPLYNNLKRLLKAHGDECFILLCGAMEKYEGKSAQFLHDNMTVLQNHFLGESRQHSSNTSRLLYNNFKGSALHDFFSSKDNKEDLFHFIKYHLLPIPSRHTNAKNYIKSKLSTSMYTVFSRDYNKISRISDLPNLTQFDRTCLAKLANQVLDDALTALTSKVRREKKSTFIGYFVQRYWEHLSKQRVANVAVNFDEIFGNVEDYLNNHVEAMVYVLCWCLEKFDTSSSKDFSSKAVLMAMLGKDENGNCSKSHSSTMKAFNETDFGKYFQQNGKERFAKCLYIAKDKLGESRNETALDLVKSRLKKKIFIPVVEGEISHYVNKAKEVLSLDDSSIGDIDGLINAIVDDIFHTCKSENALDLKNDTFISCYVKFIYQCALDNERKNELKELLHILNELFAKDSKLMDSVLKYFNDYGTESLIVFCGVIENKLSDGLVSQGLDDWLINYFGCDPNDLESKFEGLLKDLMNGKDEENMKAISSFEHGDFGKFLKEKLLSGGDTTPDGKFQMFSVKSLKIEPILLQTLKEKANSCNIGDFIMGKVGKKNIFNEESGEVNEFELAKLVEEFGGVVGKVAVNFVIKWKVKSAIDDLKDYAKKENILVDYEPSKDERVKIQCNDSVFDDLANKLVKDIFTDATGKDKCFNQKTIFGVYANWKYGREFGVDHAGTDPLIDGLRLLCDEEELLKSFKQYVDDEKYQKACFVMYCGGIAKEKEFNKSKSNKESNNAKESNKESNKSKSNENIDHYSFLEGRKEEIEKLCKEKASSIDVRKRVIRYRDAILKLVAAFWDAKDAKNWDTFKLDKDKEYIVYKTFLLFAHVSTFSYGGEHYCMRASKEVEHLEGKGHEVFFCLVVPGEEPSLSQKEEMKKTLLRMFDGGKHNMLDTYSDRQQYKRDGKLVVCCFKTKKVMPLQKITPKEDNFNLCEGIMGCENWQEVYKDASEDGKHSMFTLTGGETDYDKSHRYVEKRLCEHPFRLGLVQMRLERIPH